MAAPRYFEHTSPPKYERYQSHLGLYVCNYPRSASLEWSDLDNYDVRLG
jgi:hypothetical protein